MTGAASMIIEDLSHSVKVHYRLSRPCVRPPKCFLSQELFEMPQVTASPIVSKEHLWRVPVYLMHVPDCCCLAPGLPS